VPPDRTRARLIISNRRPASFVLPLAARGQDSRPDFKHRVIFIVTVTAGIISAMAAAWEARVILLVLFAGCLGALVLATLTSLLQSWLRIPRVFAFAAVLAALRIAVALGVWLSGPALAQQFGQLQVDVPDAARRLYSPLGESSWGHWIISNTPDEGQWSGWLSYAASGIKGAVSLAASTLACLLLIVMASLYVAAEPEFYLRGIQRIVPSSIWPKVEACLGGAVRTLRFWLLSRLISMTAVGLDGHCRPVAAPHTAGRDSGHHYGAADFHSQHRSDRLRIARGAPGICHKSRQGVSYDWGVLPGTFHRRKFCHTAGRSTDRKASPISYPVGAIAVGTGDGGDRSRTGGASPCSNLGNYSRSYSSGRRIRVAHNNRTNYLTSRHRNCTCLAANRGLAAKIGLLQSESLVRKMH
jgi:AI-2E family transporter